MVTIHIKKWQIFCLLNFTPDFIMICTLCCCEVFPVILDKNGSWNRIFTAPESVCLTADWFFLNIIFQAFSKVFGTTPDDLDMHVIYDVSHNIAKVEEHMVDGKQRTLLVHRKGSTRAFPPHHPLIPVDYQVQNSSHCSDLKCGCRFESVFTVSSSCFQLTGQPVLIGGTMGTCSYVLTGTEQGMTETFGTTCHGAVRVLIGPHQSAGFIYHMSTI